MIQIQSKVIDRFVKRLSMKQLILLTNRYCLETSYKNPQKRKESLQRGLKTFCKKGFVDECAICLDQISFETVIITPCAHMFCDICIISNLSKSTHCPMCRSILPYEYMFEQINCERICIVYSRANIGKLDVEDHVETIEEYHEMIRIQNYNACINVTVWIIRLLGLILIGHIWVTTITPDIGDFGVLDDAIESL